ncbi:ATP-binding protein [Kitasatospora kifunensis]|uniref:ATP/GTP-binding protein n=1 Tax=Kitasatospora kifunensis TaxID=58351 RepID=A0A7W7RBY2_KITKI|nr:ATP-binding protein [Kitasatospora kifunensis]MBB4929147.1 hypothetical protein [Kitasatospora kifunensis]
MLRRSAALAAAVVGLAAGLLPAFPASADDIGQCPPGSTWTGDICMVITSPGGPGGGGGSGGTGGGGGNGGGGGTTTGGGPATCSFKGQTVPCDSPNWGWFDSEDGCYYALMDPPPAAGDPAWAGHQPGDGKVYVRTCLLPGSGGGIVAGPSAQDGPTWLQTPPSGFGGGAPSPAQLAQQAFVLMKFDPPDIATAPGSGKKGVLGMPVWMWATPSAASWGPLQQSASAGGDSVTVTAKVTQIVWTMGDGQTVTCTGPGTPYTPDKGDAMSPDCGYRYTTTSAGQSSGAFPVTATTTWTVHWAGAGQEGDLPPVTKTSTTALTVGEVQVLN